MWNLSWSFRHKNSIIYRWEKARLRWGYIYKYRILAVQYNFDWVKYTLIRRWWDKVKMKKKEGVTKCNNIARSEFSTTSASVVYFDYTVLTMIECVFTCHHPTSSIDSYRCRGVFITFEYANSNPYSVLNFVAHVSPLHANSREFE